MARFLSLIHICILAVQAASLDARRMPQLTDIAVGYRDAGPILEVQGILILLRSCIAIPKT